MKDGLIEIFELIDNETNEIKTDTDYGYDKYYNCNNLKSYNYILYRLKQIMIGQYIEMFSIRIRIRIQACY